MKAYTADFPAALVARDQLEFAVAELSTFENGKVTQAFNDALAAAIAGENVRERRLWTTLRQKPSASCKPLSVRPFCPNIPARTPHGQGILFVTPRTRKMETLPAANGSMPG